MFVGIYIFFLSKKKVQMRLAVSEEPKPLVCIGQQYVFFEELTLGLILIEGFKTGFIGDNYLLRVIICCYGLFSTHVFLRQYDISSS